MQKNVTCAVVLFYILSLDYYYSCINVKAALWINLLIIFSINLLIIWFVNIQRTLSQRLFCLKINLLLFK